MFLYPLAVAIILLSLFGRFFGYDRRVFRWTIGFTLPFAVVDLVRSLPSGLLDALRLTDAVNAITLHLPLAQLGLSWLLPAILGLAIGLAIRAAKSVKA